MKSLSASPRAWITSGLLIAGIAGIHLLADEATAQTATAQVPTTVQLPTFHYFTTDGTVLVPDGGEAFLGGVGTSAAGRTEQGIPGLPSRPFTNTATGSSTGASNVSVSVQIHDFDAMDNALLGEDVTTQATAGLFHPPLAPPLTLPQLAATRSSSGQSGANVLQSVAAIRAQNAAEDAAHDQHAAAELERGRQLQTAGKLGVAKIYFQNAARQSTPGGDVHKQAVAALAAIEQQKASAHVADQ
jgi:hypothetical protein